MRPSGILRAALVAGLLAAVALPAGARDYRATYAVVRGASASGDVALIRGAVARFKFDFINLEGGSVEGPLRAVPAPTNQDPQPQTPPRSEGCLSLDAGRFGKDSGCKIVNAFVEMDPALNEGSIVVSMASRKYEGTNLIIVLAVAGEGAPEPVVVGDEPSVQPAPPALIETVGIENALLLRRSVTIQAGTVRSEGLGGLGGPIKAVDAAEIFSGLALSLRADTTCIVSVALLGGCLPN